MSKLQVTPDMLIGDVIQMLPKSADIMNAYGLHCTSCAVNVFEPIKMGAMGHGMPEETADKMIAEINKLAAETKRNAPDDGIYVTEAAAEKIKEFAKNEDKDGWALRISAEPQSGSEPAYAMDFEEKKKKDDKVFEFHGVKIFIDKKSMKNMGGAEVDYLETMYGSGFKISNPNYKKSCACGKSENGCGCGGAGACAC